MQFLFFFNYTYYKKGKEGRQNFKLPSISFDFVWSSILHKTPVSNEETHASNATHRQELPFSEI